MNSNKGIKNSQLMIPIRLTFNCRTLSPLFNSGANQNIPSLQANSVKGMLRYWWRAINFDLDLKTMKAMEQAIFGGTGEGKEKATKSNIMIRISPLEMESEVIPLLPHRNGGRGNSRTPGFSIDSTFQIQLSLTKNPIRFSPKGKDLEIELMNEEKLKALMMCWAMLGGLGRRSRRGMGAFLIESINGESVDWPNDLKSILSYLNQVPTNFSKETKQLFVIPAHGQHIEMAEVYYNKKTSFIKYPYIREILLGEELYYSNEDLLETIGRTSSHLLHNNDRNIYSTAIGSGSPRRASPIYISTIDGKTPIITCLNAEINSQKSKSYSTNQSERIENNKRFRKKLFAIQNDFINQILGF